MVDRDQLIQYLLHQMPEEERAALSEQWFTAPELHEALQLAEAELLDAYVRGELPVDERRQVEEHLLGSESQRGKLAFAHALHAAMLARSRARHTRWFGLAAAGVMIALVGTTVWYARGVAQVSSLLERAAPSRQLRPLSSAVYALRVSPDSLRGAGEQNRLKLPKAAEILRLDFEFERADQAPDYSAVVSHAGQTVWSEQGIRGSPRGPAFVVPVWIPANVLAAGVYSVELSVGGKMLAYYPFSITR
jgi:anti-sigma factor RsiW